MRFALTIVALVLPWTSAVKCQSGDDLQALSAFNSKQTFFQTNGNRLFFAANKTPLTGNCTGIQKPFFGLYDFDQEDPLIFLSSPLGPDDEKDCDKYANLVATSAVMLGDTLAAAFMVQASYVASTWKTFWYGTFDIYNNVN